MQCADIVVPQGAENTVAMELIVHHVKDQLKKVCYSMTDLANSPLMADLAKSPSSGGLFD